MPVSFFDITRQNHLHQNAINQALEKVVLSGKYILGENVNALEGEVAGYNNAKFAIGVASGTDALHLALRAVGVSAGDEVITTPFTFVATAEAIAYCNATPVFVDIEPNTFNIDPAAIKAKITKKTKALLPVHLYGQSCDMGKIMQIARAHKLKVVEDCAQAFGAEFTGKKVGAFGDVGCFSFFPTKNLGCFGDGGLVLTNNEKVADEIRVLRGHGSRKTYHYDQIGYNSRLDEIQAAILRIKLKSIGDFLRFRRKIANFYKKSLGDITEIALPQELADGRHTFNQYTIRLKGRDELFEFLKVRGISSMVYYPLSLHLQKAFSHLNYRQGDFPQSELAQQEVLSLPIFPELKEDELELVASSIKEFFKR